MSLADMPFANWNLLSVLLVLIVAGSALQGAYRGASGSARQLFMQVAEGSLTILSLFLAWRLMQAASPALRQYLAARNLEIPDRELTALSQIYYTAVTGLRDFGLMRSGVLLLIGYAVIKPLLVRLALPLLSGLYAGIGSKPDREPSWTSAPFGAVIGAVTGAGRALLLIAGVLVYTSLYPNSPLTAYAEQSALYQKGAREVVQPFTGDVLNRLPVLTQAVQDEFRNVLQRKYEVLDARVPDDVAAAAKEITAKKTTDEEKAKALYQWIGTRVKYDWEKVRLYEEKGIWKEQTPEDTFHTRTGVCIDYSRLYAIMARSVGLEVKVVTGIGYDGRGGSGPHAWNEVYLSQENKWVPLDSTWVASGGNWFNPPDFYDTHVKEA